MVEDEYSLGKAGTVKEVGIVIAVGNGAMFRGARKVRGTVLLG